MFVVEIVCGLLTTLMIVVLAIIVACAR